MVYERTRSWLEGKHISSRDEAERYLQQLGNDPNSPLWGTVLDSIYPSIEIEGINIDQFIGQQQKTELEQEVRQQGTVDRIGKFIRRVLRGQI